MAGVARPIPRSRYGSVWSMTSTTSSIGRSPSTSGSSRAPSSAGSAATMPSDGRQRMVRCLWLTLADPEPRYNGQYVYSGGLIDSVAEAGGDVEVLGLGRSTSAETGNQRAGHVVWWLPSDVPHSHWSSLPSSLPHIAYRCRTTGMQGILDKPLKRSGWDGIVFDGISTGWALPRVLDHYAGRGDRPRLIYVSHNHEESLPSPIAHNHPPSLKRH